MVFPTEALRAMFCLSLQHRFEISEDALRSRGVRLTTASGLRALLTGIGEDTDPASSEAPEEPPLIVGAPDRFALTRLLPACDVGDLDVLMYQHQLGLLRSSLAWLEGIADVDLQSNACAAAGMLGEVVPRIGDLARPTFALVPPIVISDNERLVTTDQSALRNLLEEVGTLPEPDPEGPDTEDSEDIVGEDGDSGHDGGELVVESPIEFEFENGWRIAWAPDDAVQVIRRSGARATVTEREASALVRGDRVLLISGQRRQTLYELLLSRLHDTPGAQPHVLTLRRWQRDLLNGYAKQWAAGGKDAGDLLAELRKRRSEIVTEQTVRSWVRGSTLCPDDPLDVRRLGEILDLPFLRDQYRSIQRSARRIYGLHISLAAKLDRYLLRDAAGIITNEAPLDEVLDGEFGVSFRDFRDSVMVLRVTSVARLDSPMLRMRLGELHKGD